MIYVKIHPHIVIIEIIMHAIFSTYFHVDVNSLHDQCSFWGHSIRILTIATWKAFWISMCPIFSSHMRPTLGFGATRFECVGNN